MFFYLLLKFVMKMFKNRTIKHFYSIPLTNCVLHYCVLRLLWEKWKNLYECVESSPVLIRRFAILYLWHMIFQEVFMCDSVAVAPIYTQCNWRERRQLLSLLGTVFYRWERRLAIRQVTWKIVYVFSCKNTRTNHFTCGFTVQTLSLFIHSEASTGLLHAHFKW